MKDADKKILEAKVRLADARVGKERIRRDASLQRLTRAQARGAGPDERQRLGRAYDAAEEALERANRLASAARRQLAGPTVLSEEELVIVGMSTDPELGPRAVARLRALGHGGR